MTTIKVGNGGFCDCHRSSIYLGDLQDGSSVDLVVHLPSGALANDHNLSAIPSHCLAFSPEAIAEPQILRAHAPRLWPTRVFGLNLANQLSVGDIAKSANWRRQQRRLTPHARRRTLANLTLQGVARAPQLARPSRNYWPFAFGRQGATSSTLEAAPRAISPPAAIYAPYTHSWPRTANAARHASPLPISSMDGVSGTATGYKLPQASSYGLSLLPPPAIHSAILRQRLSSTGILPPDITFRPSPRLALQSQSRSNCQESRDVLRTRW